MNCDEFAELIDDYCLPTHFIEAPEDFLAHYEECDKCRQEFLTGCRIARGLQAYFSTEQTTELPSPNELRQSGSIGPSAAHNGDGGNSLLQPILRDIDSKPVRMTSPPSDSANPVNFPFGEANMAPQLPVLISNQSPTAVRTGTQVVIIQPKPTLGGWKIAVSAAVVCSLAVAAFFAFQSPPQARHEVLAKEAGMSLERGDYRGVIVLANECLADFHATARRRHEELQKQGVTRPVGKVSAAVQAEIHQDGPYNDCATVLYYKGRAYEKLGEWQEARNAYEEAAKFLNARCWAPDQQIFWSPAEVATDRLQYGDPRLKAQ